MDTYYSCLPKPEDNLEFFHHLLGHLKIPKHVQRIIEPGDIPNGIHTIDVADNFDLIQPGAIPDSVTCVNIRCIPDYILPKKDIILKKGYLPKNLERLEIDNVDYRYADCIELRIEDLEDLKCLTHLKIIGSVKSNLSDIVCLPITHLYVSFSSEYDICCPDTLEHMYLTADHNDPSCGNMPYELPFPVKNIYIIDNYLEDRNVLIENKKYFKVSKIVQNISFNGNWANSVNLHFERGTVEFDEHFETFEPLVKSSMDE